MPRTPKKPDPPPAGQDAPQKKPAVPPHIRSSIRMMKALNAFIDAWTKAETLATGEKPEFVSGYFCGTRGLEIYMKMEDAEACSHQGDCAQDVRDTLRQNKFISQQLDIIGPGRIREALKEYGAWTYTELKDNDRNRERALWSAACDITENFRQREAERKAQANADE